MFETYGLSTLFVIVFVGFVTLLVGWKHTFATFAAFLLLLPFHHKNELFGLCDISVSTISHIKNMPMKYNSRNRF